MLKGINRLLLGALLSALAVTSCGGDKEREGAQDLYSQSKTALDEHRYTDALALLDTLNARYPLQVEIRREALRVRAGAIEGMCLDSISAGDRALAEATIRVQELGPKFRYVKSSVGLEGYYLPKKTDEKVMMATGIQARVTDQGYFYLVANVQGRSIGLSSIQFYDGSETISSSAISPSRVVKVEGSESASFNPEDLVGVGAWLESHPGASKVVLVGSKGRADFRLSPALRTEIVECWQYAEALQTQRLASIRREKYERMLATARDQLANMPVNSENTQQ